MQIQAFSSAAQAASIGAQSTSKDKSAENQVATGQARVLTDAAVEQTGESNPDRDAQGQGDGQPGVKEHIIDEVELGSDAPAAEPHALPLLPGEPPSQLDIIG